MLNRGLRVLLGGLMMMTACAEAPLTSGDVESSSPTVEQGGAVDLTDAGAVQGVDSDPSDAGVPPQGPTSVEDAVDTEPSDAAEDVTLGPPADLGEVYVPPESFGPGFTPLTGVSDSSPFIVSFGGGGELPTRTTALFGDLDDDGVNEVIISGTDEAYQGLPSSWSPTMSVVYRVDEGTNALVKAEDVPMPEGQALALMDFDGDGKDDLMMQGPAGIHWGGEPLGKAKFLETAGGEYTLEWKGVSLADIDDDGLVDLLAQPAGCCSIECPELFVVLASGRRHYTVHPELTATVNHANVCASLVAPVGETRLMMSFAATGSCGGLSHTFYEEVERDDEGWPRLEAIEAAGATGTLDLAMSSPMGGSVADVDGDGDLDLTITTDARHVLFRAEAEWPLTNATTWTGIGDNGLILPAAPLAPDRFMIPWGAAFLDLDRDGRVDVLYSHGADPNPGGGKVPKEVGPQHVTAHWNQGAWRFADVTEEIGLSMQGDWRGLTVGDLDHDGDPDLGVGGLGEYPQVYRNDIVSQGKGLSLRLKGTTSNPLGLGAMVRVQPKLTDPEQVHVAGHIGNPYGVSEPLVFVGLGEAEVAERVEITWPSGVVQALSGLAAGQLHVIEEPPTITVSPWSRRLESAGSEVAVIEAYARTPDGAIDPDAALTMTIAYGLGEASEGTPHEGGMRWEIPPPGATGSTVIEVTIDGVPLKVRPRLFWY